MANENANSPFGAKYSRQLQGVSITGAANWYTILASDNKDTFIGDLVTVAGSSALGPDGVQHPTAIQSTAADKVTGVVVAFDASRTYENQIYRTGSTLRSALVIDDPYAVFQIQADGTVSADDIGLNCDFAVGSGSTVTGQSAMTVDISEIATTAALPLRIIGIANQIKNNLVGDYTILECTLNYTTYKDTTGA